LFIVFVDAESCLTEAIPEKIEQLTNLLRGPQLSLNRLQLQMRARTANAQPGLTTVINTANDQAPATQMQMMGTGV